MKRTTKAGLAGRGATFDSLMPHRVHDILVVASHYDAFVIEEGGRLTELVLNEYVSLNLSGAPRVIHAATAEEALELLMQKRFDLVFTMLRVGSMNGFAFGRKVKMLDHTIPVVMLAFDIGELERMPRAVGREGIDHVFTWQGDARIFVAVIKLVEDAWNVDHDTSEGQVRTILLVEDSRRFASLYLPLLYTQLVSHTRNLMEDGLNLAQQLVRLRARPKVLWAKDFERAMELYERHHPYLLGVITDLSFPRGGKPDRRAGVELIHRIQADDPTMPILMQSTLTEGDQLAAEVGVKFLNKRSMRLLKDLQRFIEGSFGFGDFVFLMPDGSEWGRARDLRELERKIARMPKESLAYHSKRNDFSNWLRARTEFELASRIRPRQVEEFSSMDALREYLVDTLHGHRTEAQRGIVADFSVSRFDRESEFVRIGGGSLGGKGRGLAFANTILQDDDFKVQFPDVNILVPKTAVIATDVFDSFIADNDLEDVAYGDRTDEQIVEEFMRGHLPPAIAENLEAFLHLVDYPLAVRSSSLLEDSQSQPFAGIYRTYMLDNSHPSVDVRREQLARAIKLVYASTFSVASKAYIESTPYRAEDEKMAVILQQLVGTRQNDRFYPHVSGVARSYNFYPIAPMKARDGIAVIAMGLGRQVMGGFDALRFSPAHPRNIPQFATVRSTLDSAQRAFFALDLRDSARLPERDENANLVRLEIEEAVKDGTLAQLISSYSAENNVIYEGSSRDGHPVVTFAPILNSETFPLAAILRSVLRLAADGMGAPVEIEFAVDLESDVPRFGFLQVRRLIAGGEPEDVRVGDAMALEAFCYSEGALGNGQRLDIRDLIYVLPETFDAAHTAEIAQEVGKINLELRAESRPYVLIGPGRWGSSDPWLGVPVTWDQISGASAIVETALEDFRVAPSQGTHFFQNMTSLGIGYFTVNPFVGRDRIDWNWLHHQPAVTETKLLRHVRFDRPLRLRIDGRSSRGAILPPKPSSAEPTP